MTARRFEKPRKRFGQHFLHDRNVIARIVQVIRPQADDLLIEIGPGRGALTLPLLEQVRELAIIEIDRDLVAWWREQHYPNLTIHACDALKVDYCEIGKDKPSKIRVIGNLPYNISTPLLFHLFTFLNCIEDMHFMLQKEVVDRMCAGAGDADYGRLSVMVQFYCEVSKLFDVGAGAFSPPPRVESSVVRLQPRRVESLPVEPKHLQRVVAQAFSQRRKTLRNSLKSWFSAEQLQALSIDPTQRPEQLDLAAFIKLAQALPRT